MKARIVGIGSYLPKRILTNHDLAKMVETSDEWIIARTGIKERRIAAPDEFPSDMGVKAALNALEASRTPASSVECLLVATMTPDYISPSTACLIQAKMGIPEVPALDIQAACTGFLYALSIAKGWIESGMYKNVLVIATEKMSAFIDYKDRSTCILFGDGAAAALVAAEGPGFSIDSVTLGSDGQMAELIIIPGGGSRNPASPQTLSDQLHYFKMQGNEVFKHAVRRMTASAQTCMEKVGVKQNDISWLISHQANNRIIDAIAKQFSFPEERVVRTIHKYGNTSGSSIGIALTDLLSNHTVKSGEKLLLVAFGGGLTDGACILTKVEQ